MNTPDTLARLVEKSAASVDYSRNFASAKPNIGATEREHIEGLCNLVEELSQSLTTLQSYDAHWERALDRATDRIVGAQSGTVAYLCDNHRFKLSFDSKGRIGSLCHFKKELEGRWVALVAAEDDEHLRIAALPEPEETGDD